MKKAFLFVLLLAGTAAFAQDAQPTPAMSIEVTPEAPMEHDLVRVRLADGVKVGVINRDFDAVDVMQCENLLVFTGPPGKYLLVGFDDKGAFVQKTIEVKSDVPPPPPTPPVPPPPPTIDDTLGYGQLAYDLAGTVGDKAGAATLAVIWSQAADKLLAGEVDEQGAVDFISNESNAKLTQKQAWKLWASGLETRFDEKAKANLLPDALAYIRAFREVSAALAVYGG